MAKVLGLDHVSIIVKDADASLLFYQVLLDIELLARPNLGFSGYWINLGAGQSLHIMQLNNPNENTQRPKHGGRDYHFALRVDSIAGYVAKLDELDLKYTLSQSGRKALFIKDPDNNVMELFECSF